MYLVVLGLILGLIGIGLLNYNYSSWGFLCAGIGAVLMNKGYKKMKR